MAHVLVTGAASGIGRAVAEAFAAEDGNTLTLVDVDENGLEAVADLLDTAQLCVDLTAADAAGKTVERVWESVGEVDVLVNAAGIYPSLDMISVSADEWDRVFALNTRAPVLTTAALARLAVAASRPASVVNI
ncbi:MAG TPA: SDR family NAD(P)-dependent oxidoreductase, partial [Streptomyces sp.]|nr:SDR family NAD(P)-dependent oxidoreductase [Streptomyces sp.]